MKNNKSTRNLVAAFESVCAYQGMSKQELLDVLSDALGANYRHSRLSDWRNGKRSVPAEVQAIMRGYPGVLSYILRQALGEQIPDISRRKEQQLAEWLEQPEQVK